MSNIRNDKTTHPQIRRRREGALERLSFTGARAGEPDYFKAKNEEQEALTRKLAQRKQGSAK